MKYLLPILLMAVMVCGCRQFGYYVEQEPHKSECGSNKFVTYVWYNNEIIYSWYDDMPVSDSLVKARKKQAEDLVKAMKQ